MSDKLHNTFFVDPADVYQDYFILRESEFHHLVRALRYSAGDIVSAVDGMGNEYIGEIREITTYGEAVCMIIKIRRKPNEPARQLMLIQSLIKGDRFEYLIEKTVELGINEIIPVRTERCVALPGEHKVERWRRISAAAMKQSQRSVLPVITDIMNFPDALRYTAQVPEKLLLEAEGAVPLSQIIQRLKTGLPTRNVVIAAGPEGGFTTAEIDTALKFSFIPVSLGPRRLRAETAGIAAIAAILVSDF